MDEPNPGSAPTGVPPGRCPRCLYRLEFCLCGEVPRLLTRTRIVVIREHRERFRSSNTGRLAHLALATSALCDVGGPGRLALELELPDDAWLLFPEGEPRTVAPAPLPSTIIAIDASWPQARRMRQRLPGLLGRRMLALAPPAAATARMRKSPHATHVSTIEAIASVLRLLGEPEPADALDRLFAVAVDRQRRSGRQPHEA